MVSSTGTFTGSEGWRALAVLLSLALVLVAPSAWAAPGDAKAKAPASASGAASRKARSKPPAAARAAVAKPGRAAKPGAIAKAPAKPAEKPAADRPTAPAPSVAGPVAAEATLPNGASPAADVVKTEAGKEGEKTYTFGAQEVEGRLKSPQILYFQRRVRAQFDPAPLGHRSFLLELSDTRRHPAVD